MGDKGLQRAEVERVTGHHHQVVNPYVHVPVSVFDVILGDAHCALDLRRVPSDLRTPVIQDPRQLGHVFRWAEAVPGIGVLGHQA